ncbi:YqcI/YcgG family protein [Radiobacillus sp. PE A8.2]|uniref:YqcI/YcgG family protein n=1 Tax=Radiobacillus sp. PE A8.2 TaxID=3380349 RepID=UPI00388D36D0
MLYDSAQIINEFPKDAWQHDAYQKFQSKLTDKQMKFPCIPATQGLALDQFRYGFIDDPTKQEAYKNIALLLTNYSHVYKNIGNYTSLVLFFKNAESTRNYSIANYESLFWEILSQSSDYDPSTWPEKIPTDSNDSLWEFCFEQERFFVFAATPAHEHRQSRNFPYFMFAITPRWVFDSFQQQKSAQAIKKRIRERLNDYDAIEPHPELKLYGEKDNHEAKQYFLRDDQSSLSQCPFHRSLSNKD